MSNYYLNYTAAQVNNAVKQVLDGTVNATNATNADKLGGVPADNYATKEYANNLKISIDQIYPVGSIYMSVNSTNPSTLFGGTWERIKDKFLLSAGDSYSAGTTGGNENHNHTISVGKAWATVGNYAETIAFAGNVGQSNWKNYTGSTLYYWTHNSDAALTSSHQRYESGCFTNVYGETDSNSNMPPYLAVYMWKRTA